MVICRSNIPALFPTVAVTKVLGADREGGGGWHRTGGGVLERVRPDLSQAASFLPVNA